jgi:hypothetical protein
MPACGSERGGIPRLALFGGLTLALIMIAVVP